MIGRDIVNVKMMLTEEIHHKDVEMYSCDKDITYENLTGKYLTLSAICKHVRITICLLVYSLPEERIACLCRDQFGLQCLLDQLNFEGHGQSDLTRQLH